MTNTNQIASECAATQTDPRRADLVYTVNTAKTGSKSWRKAMNELEAINLESHREHMRSLIPGASW